MLTPEQNLSLERVLWKTKLFNGKETNVENLNNHRKFLKQIINILRKSNAQDQVYCFDFGKIKICSWNYGVFEVLRSKVISALLFRFQLKLFENKSKISKILSNYHSMIWRYFWKVAKVHSFLKQSLVFKSMIVQTLFWKRMDFRCTYSPLVYKIQSEKTLKKTSTSDDFSLWF